MTGVQTCALPISIANLGYADIRFSADVFPGDTLSVRSEIIGLKENSSRRSGIVYVRSTAENQNGREVLTWIRWVMVHKRDPNAESVQPAIPALYPVVLPERLSIDHYTMLTQNVTSMTGVTDLWDDYVVGERIDHPGSMTVNDSDHSIATRLYQNTAKAHFDGFGMASSGGQRLVYGGHIISLCKALAYDGLENGLSIIAINSGSHVNPTFAGDTVACATLVLDKIDLGVSHIGALRLRMIGVKDAPAASIVFPDNRENKPAYPSNVVLDLDYTIVIPKQP